MKKSLLALTVSLAAASGANAAWFSGVATSGNSNIGNGEMVLVMWDQQTQTSYVQDLGVRFDDLKAGTVNTAIALDSVKLNTAFGGNYANVQWLLGAASNHWSDAGQTAYETLNFGLFASGRATSIPDLTDGQSQLDITQARFQSFSPLPALVGGSFQTGSIADNGAEIQLNGAANYLGGLSFGSQFTGNLPGNMQVLSAVGQTTNLWFFGFADNELQSPITEIRGTATLANGALTISQGVSEVPVPAAAWLLGSALLGLGGVARSRKKA